MITGIGLIMMIVVVPLLLVNIGMYEFYSTLRYGLREPPRWVDAAMWLAISSLALGFMLFIIGLPFR